MATIKDAAQKLTGEPLAKLFHKSSAQK